jgi:hypothetical protein
VKEDRLEEDLVAVKIEKESERNCVISKGEIRDRKNPIIFF